MNGHDPIEAVQDPNFVLKLSDITVLLDRSASMRSVQQETIDGFNGFLSAQRAASGQAVLSQVQFDSHNMYEQIGPAATPVNLTPDLTPQSYQPRGGTPLWDALGTCMLATDARLCVDTVLGMHRDIVFVVITDGYENASRRFNREEVIAMIRHRETVLGWKFIYLGANVDTFGRGYVGSCRERSVSIDKTKIHQAMTLMSDKLAAYRRSGDQKHLDWTGKERSDLS